MSEAGFGEGRPPCGGWPAQPVATLGGCGQSHAKISESAIEKWNNVTQVTDYHTDSESNPVSIGGIRPYPKPQNTGLPSSCTDPSVGIPFCAGEPPTPANDYRKCGPWTNAEKPTPVNDSTHTTIDGNIYEKVEGATVDYSKCRRIGFKNAQSRKFWHGTYGYMSEFHGAPDGWCALPCGCPIRNEKTYPDQTKYRTIVIRGEHELNYVDYSGITFSSRTLTVDRYSGIVTLDAWSEYVDPDGGLYVEGALQSARDQLLGPSTFNIFSLAQTWCSEAGTNFGEGLYDYLNVAYTGSNGVYNAKGYLDYGVPGTPDLRLAKEIDVNMGSGTLTAKDYNWNESNARYIEFQRNYILTNTTMKVENYTNQDTEDFGRGITKRIRATLSVPYTATQLYQDAVNLLEEYNLADNAVYPWREDDYENVAPLVTRNEVLQPRRPDGAVAVAEDWVDDQIALLTARGSEPGSIVGAPLPAGYGPHFNWLHRTWRMCRDEEGIEQFYVSHVGAWGGVREVVEVFENVVEDQIITLTDGGITYLRAERYSAIGVLIATGAQDIDYLVDNVPGTVEILTDVLVTAGTGEYVQITYSFGELEGTGDHTDSFMPNTATQWTENSAALPENYFLLPKPGAWAIFNGTATPELAAGCLVLQKWAEVIQRRPSQNFFRPCNSDRVLFETAQTRCIDEELSAGTDIYLLGADTGIITGDECIVSGFGDSGIWEVTRISNVRFTLTTKIADLPTGWEVRGAMFGRARFPAAWPICGRVAIVAATNATPIVLTLSESCPNLRTGDQINVTEVLGNTAANGASRTVTRVDDTHFSLDSSVGNATYTSGGFAQSIGSPDYTWHDDRSKGDYGLMTWEFDYRYVGENLRLVAQHTACGTGCISMSVDNPGVQRRLPVGWGMPENPRYWEEGLERCEVSSVVCASDCRPHHPCAPSVICISPNYDAMGAMDSFTNGKTYPFPETFAADETYSSLWQRTAQQFMDDKLWQPPPRPCDLEAGAAYWTEDEGTCIPDGAFIGLPPLPAYFYPMRPFVEVICSLPTDPDAPELAAGYLGCLSIAELDVEVIATPGNVCPPPEFQGILLNTGIVQWRVRQTPWGVWIRQHACVENNGRWKAEYILNGAG